MNISKEIQNQVSFYADDLLHLRLITTEFFPATTWKNIFEPFLLHAG